MLIAAAPSPLWFATRGAGTATLVLLTAVVLLGVSTAGSTARGRQWPRFLSAGLHRNLSLFAIVFLLLHIATAIADPYAKLGLRDATIPFASAYRPFWLGLGVVAGELLLALVVTSLLRHLVGFGTWRAIHWLAYAAWPVAVLHSLGTGTDAPAPWSIVLTAGCILAVVAVVIWRLAVGSSRTAPVRSALAIAMVLGVVGTSAWAADGPLRPGWARRAGTPPALIAGNATSSSTPPRRQPSPTAAPNVIQDPVAGSYIHLPAGRIRLILTDLRDPTLQFVVRSAEPGEPGPLLAVVHSGQTGCIASVAAVVAPSISAICGKTRIDIFITAGGTGNHVTGSVVIQPS